MRDTLGWSYSAAGFMNTINAAGYLAGALMTSKLIAVSGWRPPSRWGTLACVVSLALCALSGNFFILSSHGCSQDWALRPDLWPAPRWRRPSRSRGLHGPIFCSVFSTPDPGSASSRRGWSRLSCCRLLGRIVVDRVVGDDAARGRHDAAAVAGTDRQHGGIASEASATFALRPVLIYLAGYFLFGAGYIAYMTFMIAYVRDAGAARRRRAPSGA